MKIVMDLCENDRIVSFAKAIPPNTFLYKPSTLNLYLPGTLVVGIWKNYIIIINLLNYK